jgi:aminoglycoside phosphotransferase (APT) family kinase protein
MRSLIAQLHRIKWFKLPQHWRGRGERSASVGCWSNEWDALQEEEDFESVVTISFRRKDSPIRSRCFA